jgi:hypothetical protein
MYSGFGESSSSFFGGIVKYGLSFSSVLADDDSLRIGLYSKPFSNYDIAGDLSDFFVSEAVDSLAIRGW